MENNDQYKMITKEILQQIAGRKGLVNKEYIEKDYFQDIVLFNIYKETNLLVFKGGTALYKLYGLPRFSEDLDFTLLNDLDVEKTIFKIVTNIGGAQVKDIKKTKTSILIKINFNGILTYYNTVRIDISLKNRVLEKFDVKSYVSNYIDINPFSIRTLCLKEMVAEKVHSIFAREKARDLYDLFFLLKLAEVDMELITKKLAIFEVKFALKTFEIKINKLKNIWVKELESFTLSEVPDFKTIKNFVLRKFKV